MSSNTSDDYGNDYGVFEVKLQEEATYLNSFRMLYIVGYLIICILGIPLNFLVIVTGCCSYHKLRKNVNIWVLALAMTHLLCCAFLPLQLLYAWHHFNWHYGATLCKVSSYVTYTSMFSTAAVLSLWSISNSMTSCNWCMGLRTRCLSHRMSMFFVLSAWTFGAVLSLPSLFSRELRYTEYGQECIDDYDIDKQKTTDEGRKWHIIVVVCRFMLGILVPAFVVFVSCCLTRRRHRDLDGTCKRIICVIKGAFFVCWTPLIFLGVLQVTMTSPNLLKYILPPATLLAAAHCCVNPLTYMLVGCNIKLQWMSQVSSNTPQDTYCGDLTALEQQT